MTGDINAMVTEYVEFKRALGFFFDGEEQRLRAFAMFAAEEGVTVESALAWAVSGSGHPRSYQAQRYETVRRFSAFAHALRPKVPSLPPGVLGATADRVVPYPYSDDDVAVLMHAASLIRSADGLKAKGMEFLIGLMRACGLRIGEALGLEDRDFDAQHSTLDIRVSKNGSSRRIPLSADVASHVAAYMTQRDRLTGRAVRTSAQMVLTTDARPLSKDSAEDAFGEIRWSLLGRGQVFYGRAPRLHDLRHAFAVRTIIRWHDAGEDVNSMMPYLSAYLGHRKISDTYWYLTGVPELMEVATSAFGSMGLLGGGGDEL